MNKKKKKSGRKINVKESKPFLISSPMKEKRTEGSMKKEKERNERERK